MLAIFAAGPPLARNGRIAIHADATAATKDQR
jgi:hypothetical protein